MNHNSSWTAFSSCTVAEHNCCLESLCKSQLMSLFSDHMSGDLLLIFSVKCRRSMNIRASSGDVNKNEDFAELHKVSMDVWLLWDTLGQVTVFFFFFNTSN